MQSLQPPRRAEWNNHSFVTEPELLDLDQFESLDQAKSAIERDRGFDESVKAGLAKAVEGDDGIQSRPRVRTHLYLTCSSVS